MFLMFFCPLPLLAQTPQPVSIPTDSITFDADHITYNFKNERIDLTGNATLKYRDITLTAGHILYNRKTRQMTAQPLPDSTGARTIGLPKFKRNTETISAQYMLYDLKTERGNVKQGRASQQRKYYQGENILLDNNPQALNAIDLSMSTCNKDHVHYDFLCKNVRVLQNDQAVGRSVTFRIGPVPIFWLPFFVFPTKQGRQSGLLTPSVGSNDRDGIFVRNIGYYYAPSDYWDATLKATLRERGGFLIASRFVYAVKNRLSGSIDLDYDHTTTGTSSTNSWRLNLQHQQRINATTNIRGSGQFTTSSTFNERNSDELYTYLNQQLRSSFSIDKRWTESRRSIDGSVTYYRDLEAKTNSFQGFPRLSFRQSSRTLFARNNTTTQNPAWYRAIRYDFNSNLTNNFTYNPDTTDTRDLTMQSAFNLNSQHKPMGWLDLTPRFSLNELFKYSDTDSITRRETYTASVNVGTSLYGIFQTNLGRIKGFRHRLQPRISINYNQNSSLIGGTFGFGGTRDWGDPRRSLNFSLNNSLEIKTEHEEDVRRFTFATLNISTGYDLDNTLQKWRDLNTTASIKPDQRVDMRLTMRHELQNVNGDFKPRLESFTITSNFRFNGRQGSTSASQNNFQSASQTQFGIEGNLSDNFGDTTQPWRFGLTHYLNYSKLSPTSPATKRSWLKADLGLNPTTSLRLDYSINVELVPTRSLTAQSLSIYRDLHCWEARLSWYPTGFNKGYYFRINIKDIPQIKFEHRKGGFGI
ncbi:MAG: LPS-assembly protein LptD [Candidatus Latescibacteria bacterium]|nr:LPS-assembly protein LptD [Candidatus Latescibacterota bacterium]